MIDLGNVFILGDSYSTFEEYIPSGYVTWYTKGMINDTDVNSVEQTWWKQLINETNSALVRNCSWSSTTVCHTGYEGDCSEKSFITRIDNLFKNGFFTKNKIDTFFILGGTNDSLANSPIGNMMFSGWQKKDLFSYEPAVCYLLHKLKENLLNTRIVFIVNCDIKQEIIDSTVNICEKYGVEKILLKNIEKRSNHPNIKGMLQIKDQILNFLKENNN